MFSSALKSFSSNISSNYTVSPNPSSTSGPWRIHDAKKKSTSRAVSVFVFDKKSLDPTSGLARSAGSSLRKTHDAVLERLRKEASALARLRHPSVLELVEPVEDTRNGGLMFATEQVTASLAGLLEEKDSQEGRSGVGGKPSRYVVEEVEGGGRRRREVEIDELEIQKGLLQLGKGLEFLHESAGLVHANFTPESIYINSKSDWKISGLSFCSAPQDSDKATAVGRISLNELLHHDPRLPKFVQMNLDYTSPDFVMDNNLNTSADMFSLGLVIVALYNSPHHSPLQPNSSVSGYKRLFNSSSTTPSQNNQFLSSRPFPNELANFVLPKLLTRRPAQRMNSREFQQSPYFDNILVSTIRFLDNFPAKTPNEKSQFMRGLTRVLSQFPSSVLEKKILPALVDEMKDHDLLSVILQNVFKLLTIVPSRRRSFSEKVIPSLREVFLGAAGSKSKGPSSDRDVGKESGLMVIIENLPSVIENCPGKDFKDDILPLVRLALESPTNSLIDASLRAVPTVLPVLDYSTIKHEFFPVVAAVFTKTSSLAIKVRGLEAFVAFCGGSEHVNKPVEDDLDGIASSKKATKKTSSSSSALDKYTIQEKIVPLLKAIKTKEPAVMMAALKVLKPVGKIADTEFVARDALPILWNMALGPLLSLEQFQAFMEQIKSLSARIEREHSRKLEELSTTSNGNAQGASNDDFMSFDRPQVNTGPGAAEGDFESLVFGRNTRSVTQTNGSANSSRNLTSALNGNPLSGMEIGQETPKFSWSTTGSSSQHSQNNTAPMTVQPNLGSFAPLSPSHFPQSGTLSPPLQPQQPQNQHHFNGFSSPSTNQNTWANQQPNTSMPPAPLNQLNNSFTGMTFGQSSSQPSMQPNYQPNTFTQQHSGFSSYISPPPTTQNNQQTHQATNSGTRNQDQANPNSKSGLDQYESLL